MAERKPSNVAVLNRPLTDDVDSLNGSDGADTGANGVSGSLGEGTEGGASGDATTSSEDTAVKAPKRNLDDAPDDEMVGVTLRIPNGFRKLLANTAVNQKISVPQMLAQMAAEAFSYALPKPERAPRTKRYDSPEERREAQKRDQQRQRLIARKALDAVEKGTINLDMAALIAEVDKELEAKAEADKANAAATGADTTPQTDAAS